MSQESVEYLVRQLDKVKQPRSLVKVVRAHNRELRRQRKADTEKAQVEALGRIAQELIRAGGQALGNQITGPLLIIGILSSNEPGRKFLISAGDGVVKLAAVLAKAIGDAWKTSVIPELVPQASGETGGILPPIPPLIPFGPWKVVKHTIFGTISTSFSSEENANFFYELSLGKIVPLFGEWVEVINPQGDQVKRS